MTDPIPPSIVGGSGEEPSNLHEPQPDFKPDMPTVEQTLLGPDTSAANGDDYQDRSTAWSLDLPRQLGRYRIESELGRGGMGAVYLAHDLQLDRKVALKVPHFAELDDADSLERFYREARAMAALRHNNLCPVYDVGKHGQWHFMTMAYIEGQSLAENLRSENRLSLSQGLSLLRTVALALQKAHDVGIVHRDLKPSNIMLTADLEPIIMDFGLARRAQPGEAELTHSGVVIGSPAYMAPEQVEARHSEISPATDVYALGVILYVLTTGKRPFEGSAASIFGQIVSTTPAPPSTIQSGLPRELDTVCLKSLEKTPGNRYSSATEFADALAEVAANSQSFDSTIIVSDSKAGAVSKNDLTNSPAVAGSREAATSSRSRSRRDAELRHVTITCFNFEADEGSMQASASSASEQLIEQSTAFAEFVESRIREFGGVIVSGSGQEVVACFGFPVAYEDSSQRAVRAALAFRNSLAEMDSIGKGLPLPDQTWVTVHSGEAIAEQTSDDHGAVIQLAGEARNTGARLNALGEPGTIQISAATYQRVSLFFECESLGKHRVRGLTHPMELFRVHREASSRNRIELVDPGNLTPLIGRDTELSILKDRWEQALEELGQVVLLIGDAGLGKSRLIREIREHITGNDADNDAAIVEFRCSQYHSNAAWFPLVEYLARLLNFERLTAAADRLNAIQVYLRELNLLSEINGSLLAGLLSVPNGDTYPELSLAPQRQKELTKDLMRNWLRSLTERSPVLFIVEDLHWIDPTTMDFVKDHVEGFQAGRLLTLLTFRPEFQTPWHSLPHQTQIALNRLTRRQIAEVMKRITKRRDLPDAVVQQIAERTDGVPLFIEEFTHLVTEAGILDQADSDLSRISTAIPATLQELLLSRLDRMESNHDVIQLAAVAGREFSYELLAAASDLPEAELQQELDKLVRAEVLFQKGRAKDARYIFKHALIQDSAYNALLTKKRCQFHQRIAETLEQHFPEIVNTQPDLLARHFTEAGNVDRASQYWLKAGERARERSAHLEAIQHLTEGLAVIATKPDGAARDAEELQFQMPLSASYIAVRGYAAPEVEEHIQRSRELCERLGPASPLFHVMMIIWALRFIRGQAEASLEVSHKILDLAETRDDSYKTEALWSRTGSSWWAGHHEETLQLSQRGVSLYTVDGSHLHANILQQNCGPLMTCYVAWSLWMLGRPDEAWPWLAQALELAERLNDRFTLVVTQWQYSFTTAIAGRTKETLALTERVLSVSEEQSYEFWRALGLGIKGTAMRIDGNIPAAVKLLQEAIQRCDDIGSGILHTCFLGELAEALWQNNQRSEAWKALDRAQDHNDRLGQRVFEPELKRRRGLFLLDESPDNASRAEQCWNEGLSTSRNQKARMFELRLSVALAELWAKSGQTDKASALLQSSLAAIQGGSDSIDVITARSLLATLE